MTQPSPSASADGSMRPTSADYEQVAQCPLCGGTSHAELYVAHRLHWTSRIVQCPDCGLVSTNPRLTKEALGSFYQDSTYFDGTSTTPGFGHRYAELGGSSEEAGFRIAFVERTHPARGRLLEVGCATGFNLLAARNRGWSVEGIEPSAWARDYATSHHRLSIIAPDLETLAAEPQSYDAVTLYHVLEHLPDPLESLRRCRRLLRNSGVLAVEVPDFGSRLSRKLGADSPHLAPPEHLYHFTQQTLIRCLDLAGFETRSLVRKGGAGVLFFRAVTERRSSMLSRLFAARQLVYRHPRLKAMIRHVYWHWLRNNDSILVVATPRT